MMMILQNMNSICWFFKITHSGYGAQTIVRISLSSGSYQEIETAVLWVCFGATLLLHRFKCCCLNIIVVWLFDLSFQ